VGITINNVDG
jgi:hypothetical protein